MGNGLLSIQIIPVSRWQLRLSLYQRVRFSTVAAYITLIIIIIVGRPMTARAVQMTIFRSALIIVRAMVARAILIPTTTLQFSHKHQFCNTKRLTRRKSSRSTPTALSTAIHRAYRPQPVPSCNQSTANKAHPSSRPKTLTAILARVRPTARWTQRLLHRRHQNVNDLWTHKAKRTSYEHWMLWDLVELDSAKVGIKKFTTINRSISNVSHKPF